MDAAIECVAVSGLRRTERHQAPCAFRRSWTDITSSRHNNRSQDHQSRRQLSELTARPFRCSHFAIARLQSVARRVSNEISELHGRPCLEIQRLLKCRAGGLLPRGRARPERRDRRGPGVHLRPCDAPPRSGRSGQPCRSSPTGPPGSTQKIDVSANERTFIRPVLL